MDLVVTGKKQKLVVPNWRQACVTHKLSIVAISSKPRTERKANGGIRREGSRLVLEPSPVDGNGWPVGFRTIFGAGGDASLDLGVRMALPERKAPLGPGKS
jgi:hypothetical protein